MFVTVQEDSAGEMLINPEHVMCARPFNDTDADCWWAELTMVNGKRLVVFLGMPEDREQAVIMADALLNGELEA